MLVRHLLRKNGIKSLPFYHYYLLNLFMHAIDNCLCVQMYISFLVYASFVVTFCHEPLACNCCAFSCLLVKSCLCYSCCIAVVLRVFSVVTLRLNSLGLSPFGRFFVIVVLTPRSRSIALFSLAV